MDGDELPWRVSMRMRIVPGRSRRESPGTRLRFVGWYSGKKDIICHQPADSVPSFRAKVVAVSGQVAVVVDLRHPSAAAYLDPAKLGWLRDAAAVTDRALLSTLAPAFRGFPGRASRRVSGEHTLVAADGGHAALYLMGDGARGISLELVSMALTARIVRLSRLR